MITKKYTASLLVVLFFMPVSLYAMEKSEENIFDHGGYVSSVACSEDDSTIVSGGPDGKVKVWSWSENELIGEFDHGADVRSVDCSEDGLKVVVGGPDGKVKVWSWSKNKLIGEFDHGADVRSVSCSNDGLTIASGGPDGIAKVWRIGKEEPIAIFYPDKDDCVYKVILGKDGLNVAVLLHGYHTARLIFWNIRDKTKLKTHQYPVGHLALFVELPNKGALRTSLTPDGKVKVWKEERNAESLLSVGLKFIRSVMSKFTRQEELEISNKIEEEEGVQEMGHEDLKD